MSSSAKTLRHQFHAKKISVRPNKSEPDFALLAERIRRLGIDFVEIASKLEVVSGHGKTEFCIASAGIMNPGKSTLLNALLGKEEIFKTADVRETTEVKSVPWKENTVLVDTPGFSSAFADDDCEATSALHKADLILFVHNIATGGLNKAELDVLVSLEEFFGEKNFAKRVFIVNTRSDECPDESLDVNCGECLDLLKENIGCRLESFVVSPKLYLDGIRAVADGNKADGTLLVKESGIEVLYKAIVSRMKNGNKSTRKAIVDQVICELKEQLETLERLRDKKSSDIRKEATTMASAWKNTLAEIRPYWEECRK